MADILTDIGQLIPEAQVYETFRHLLKNDELLEARKAGLIGYYRLSGAGRGGGAVAYTMAQLVQYFETKKVEPCQNNPLAEEEVEASASRSASKSAANGSGKSPAAKRGTVIGMTPALVESAAERLGRPT